MQTQKLSQKFKRMVHICTLESTENDCKANNKYSYTSWNKEKEFM